MGNANIWQRTFRNIHLLRKCMAANTPQGVGADSSRPFFNPNQMVLMCRNDANCNAIWWNYVGAVWGIAMPFYGCSWVRYDVLQYQRWEYATPFCGCSWAWYDVLQNKKHSLKKQKPYFCNAKTYFLHAKNHTFATQKGGFWNPFYSAVFQYDRLC